LLLLEHTATATAALVPATAPTAVLALFTADVACSRLPRPDVGFRRAVACSAAYTATIQVPMSGAATKPNTAAAGTAASAVSELAQLGSLR
jgi:hypothetical protein